jgi:flagellar hook-associated protein 2
MTISFSGLASGLDTSSWVEALVSIKQQKVTTLQTQLAAYQTTKSTLTDTKSSVSSLRNALEKITDAKFGGTFDLFAKNTANSSNTDVFTATATSSATKQNYDITVQQLASYTKATSQEAASAVADDSTKLTDLGITSGSLTVYVDGVKNAINVSSDDTLGDLKSRLASAGVKASMDENGVLNISSYDNKKVSVGATTDSSNFVSLVGLTKQEDGSYSSTNSLFKANTSTKLTSENSGFNQAITAGTFTIGDATFTIDDNTTLSSLISQINESDDAQAYAYWDDTSGKLSITSKKEGASYINIEAGTSNFTDAMGFTSTTRDADGNIISSQMYTDAQELGDNAIFTINGTSITSTSNTVTSDISRITGVTLTLNKVSSEEDGTSTLKIEQDSEDLVAAVKSFVEAYNSTISKITEVTASGGDLERETSLTSLKSTIRKYANGSNDTNGGVYKLLSEIGISTSSASSTDLSTDTNTLYFDEDTFLQALQENPDSVKSILAGDNGILNQIENTVEQSLKASVGFFDVKESSLNTTISNMETKITNQQTKVDNYQSQLETKFSNMELLISQMQQNYSSFLSS